MISIFLMLSSYVFFAIAAPPSGIPDCTTCSAGAKNPFFRYSRSWYGVHDDARYIPLLTSRHIAPLELARQLTLQDHELFSSIRLSEFLKQNWTRKDSDVKAPHIKRMIAQFNRNGYVHERTFIHSFGRNAVLTHVLQKLGSKRDTYGTTSQ